MKWYRDTPPAGRRAFWAAFGGWALEAADAQIYGLVLPTLISLWGLSKGDAGLISSVTLISTAFGGWLAGAASDRWGRARVLRITIMWYAIATAAVGFANGFTSLLIFRSLQGIGFGGEWAAGAVLVSEFVRTRYRGRVLGTVQSGWAVGWGISLIVYSLLVVALPSPWVWRVQFWLGVLPALLVVAIRRGVTDAPVRAGHRGSGSPLALFRPNLLRATIFGALLGLGSHGGYYALTTFLPTFLRSNRGLTVLASNGYLAVLITASFFGYLTSGWLSDRIGRRRNIVFFALCCLLTLPPYLLIDLGPAATLIAGAPLGFFTAGIPGGLGALFAELYPTEVRGTGEGFCYNAGRLVSAAFPALVGYLSDRLGLALSIAVFAGLAYTLAAAAAYCLPETRERGLPDVPDETAKPISPKERLS
ncbi:MFS transporter [Nocardia sp. NPDC052278]|uniref:MFS transporter n=1 Tax=unclassified Nocardia TaxID=2637762 RepID=UPI0036B45BF6